MNFSTLSDMPAPIRRVLKRFGFTASHVCGRFGAIESEYVSIIRGKPYRVCFPSNPPHPFIGSVTNDHDNTQIFTAETAVDEIQRLVLNDLFQEKPLQSSPESL